MDSALFQNLITDELLESRECSDINSYQQFVNEGCGSFSATPAPTVWRYPPVNLLDWPRTDSSSGHQDTDLAAMFWQTASQMETMR